MKKIHLILILVGIVPVVVLSGRMLADHRAHVQDLEEFRVRQLQEWIVTQRSSAYGLDRAVAKALASPGGDHLHGALGDALDRALRAQANLWGSPAATQKMQTAVDRWGLRRGYESVAGYLDYLLERDDGPNLGDAEVENLQRIRSYALLYHRAFDELLTHVQYEEKTSSGYRSIHLHRWSRIQGDDGMICILDQLGREVSLLEDVGGDDPGYRAFLDARLSATPSPDRYCLAESGERGHSHDEMLKQAVLFAETIAEGNVEVALPPPPATGPTDVVVSEGVCSSIGEHATFRLLDAGTGWRYSIGVTSLGGHIFKVRLEEGVSEIGSAEVILQVGEELVNRWADFEGVSLEKVSSSITAADARFSFAPVVGGILHHDRPVFSELHLQEPGTEGRSVQPQGPAVTIYSDRYFLLYSHPGAPDPEITAREAVARLGPRLVPSGQARLELRGERLLYAIPVEGVRGVERVFIDAVSGELGWMEYRWVPDEGAGSS